MSTPVLGRRMKRAICGLLLVLLLSSMFTFIAGIGHVKALDPQNCALTSEVLDFKNGTKEMIIDFGNATRNCIAETFVKKTAELEVSNETDQSQISIPTGSLSSERMANTLSSVSSEESVNYVNATQTILMKQPMLLGFTYTLAYWQEQWTQEGGWWIFSWYLTVGVDIDIQFGLRLPIEVTLEYPEQMAVGNDYTIHTTLDPVNKTDFDELLLTFKANIWAQAGLAGISIPRTVLWGPDVDESQSFITPLGSNSAPLFLTLRINIFDIIEHVFPSLKGVIDVISHVVVPYLTVQPTFGSRSITANATVTGDARVVDGAALNWSEPHQTLDFVVYADEYDSSTNYSRLVLSDFRYYFTNFGVDFWLELDFNDTINWFLGIANPIFHIYTLDMSWINRYIGTRSVTSHSGYPGSIYVTIYVDRIANPPPLPPPPEDVAISYASVYPSKVFSGQDVNVSIDTKNLGNVYETFNVTVYADDIVIDRWTVAGLNSGEEIERSFNWNTAGFSPWHTYNITTEASELPNETDTENNVLFAGAVQIVLLPPQANFAYSPIPPIRNQTTTFDASVSISGNGTIINYVWNFGEGVNMTTTNPIATYVFSYHGNHRVMLTVIDSDGLNDTVSEVVDVLQRDVAVVDVLPYRNWVYEGRLVPVNVTLLNCGDFNETVTVDLYYNLTANQQIGTIVTDLSPNETKTLTFVWNTLGVQHCHNYTITALANIQFDSNTTNNVNEGTIRIKVRIMGDINGDGKVDMKDIALAASAFGSYPSHPRWNPDADIDENYKINLKDIALISKHFGECA